MYGRCTGDIREIPREKSITWPDEEEPDEEVDELDEPAERAPDLAGCR